MAAHQHETHHGVMMQINRAGVLIIGQPNIGKSTFALELLHHGHQLIADDIVEFINESNGKIIGHCPEILNGFLHTRELGLVNVEDIFGSDAYTHQHALDYVVELKQHHESSELALAIEKEHYLVCGNMFPKISLTINSPATLIHRLTTWMKMQATTRSSEKIFSDRQRQFMTVQ